jgi:predicted transport protein
MQHKNWGNIKVQNRRTHLTLRMNNTEYNGTRHKLSTTQNAGTLGSRKKQISSSEQESRSSGNHIWA